MNTAITDWTEKYRPCNLSELIGNSNAINKLRQWSDSWKKGRPKKQGAILVGNPGIGKTSAAHALAKENGWDMIELNASDKRNASSIERIVGHGSQADGFSEDGRYYSSADGNLKLIVFDEADNLFGREDYGGAKAIVQSLRRARQPIILIVNDYYELTRRASGIKQLAVTIRFNQPTSREVVEALSKIINAENMNISLVSLQEIARNSEGDIRAAINDLQSVAQLRDHEIEQIIPSLGWRDIPPKIFGSLETIFSSGNPIEARQSLISLDETPDRFIIWLDDNLPRVIRDTKELENAYQLLSRADIFLGRVIPRQYYGFWSYATDLMSMGISEIAKKKGRIYSDTLRFPEYLIKLSRSKSRRGSLKSLISKTAREFHTSPTIARDSIIPYIRSLFMRRRDFAISFSRTLDLSPGEMALLMGVESDSSEIDKLQEMIESNDIEPIEFNGEEQKEEDAEQRSLFEF